MQSPQLVLGIPSNGYSVNACRAAVGLMPNKAIKRMVFKLHFCHSASLHFMAKVQFKSHRLSRRYARKEQMIFNPNEQQAQLPLPATEKWIDGVWDVEVFKHGSMSLIYFAPEGTDYQTPHSQDEWYFVLEGSGIIEIEGKEHSFSQGSAIFVAAGKKHKFLGNLSGIKMWAVFYGPNGGEKNA